MIIRRAALVCRARGTHNASLLSSLLRHPASTTASPLRRLLTVSPTARRYNSAPAASVDPSNGSGSGGGSGSSSGGSSSSSKDEDEDTSTTARQKWQHFFACAVPMVGFGLMDNTIMIHAGDLIDNFFGHFLRFTLVAAAFGQLFSDVAGVIFGGAVEAMAIRCGFDAPAMTHAQRSLRSTKCVGTLGAALGVMLGCCLGMVNLLFLDLEKAERMKQAEKMRTLFDAIIAEGWELVNSDRCTLYMLQDLTRTRQDDPMPDHPTSLFTMVRHGVYPSPHELEDAFHSATGMDPTEHPDVKTEHLAKMLAKVGYKPSRIAQILPEGKTSLTYDEYSDFMTEHMVQDQCTVPLREGGTKWHVVKTGKVLNIPDVYEDPRFENNRLADQFSGYQSRSILIGPVKDSSGRVIGIIEMINKMEPFSDGSETRLEVVPFDEEDEKLLHLMCAHCATFTAHALGGEE